MSPTSNQQVPIIRNTRASTDTSRPVPATVDRARLHPNTSQSAAGTSSPSLDAPSKQQERHNANSAAFQLLSTLGIPYHDVREKVDQGRTTNLSASNVEQKHLKKFNWEFTSHITRVTPLSGHDIISGIEKSLFKAAEHGLGRRVTDPHLIKIPEDWVRKNPVNTSQDTMQACLRLQLCALQQGDADSVLRYEVAKREEIERLEYPAPKITVNETTQFPEDAALCIEWMMLKILGYPGLSNFQSEMDVERHVGSNIASVFNVAHCVTTSNMELRFPTAIGCFGSFPKPDFVSRVEASSLHQYLKPVVFVGEAKRDTPPGMPVEKLRVTAQLAWAVQPTLTLMIMEAVTKWMADKTKAVKFRLPGHSFVYGVAYDKAGIIIYSFFPRLLGSDRDGTPNQWGFACVPVETRFTSVFNSADRSLRMDLIQALCVAQRHAVFLFEKLKGMTVPPQLSACVALWDSQKLWST